MELLRRIDRGISRGEAFLATAVLLGMIVVAALQAGLRNLTNLGVSWANEALANFAWADQFLQKGTLWVAFLGASLAVSSNKHIAIDILARLSGRKTRAVIVGITSIAAGIVCIAFARVFFMSIMNIASDIPLSYEILLPDGGRAHLCDAPAAVLAEQGLSRPGLFCGIRNFLAIFDAAPATPENGMQMIIPPALLLMAVRFLFKGVGAFLSLRNGGLPDPDDAPVGVQAEASAAPASANKTEES